MGPERRSLRGRDHFVYAPSQREKALHCNTISYWLGAYKEWSLLVKLDFCKTLWCHQMETFSALLAICVGNSLVSGEFPTQRPVTWSFDVFFDLRLNKRLSKQSWGWWFETPSCPLWLHCNGEPRMPLFPAYFSIQRNLGDDFYVHDWHAGTELTRFN